MIKNYLISTLRNLAKNKTYATINILGLALGISCCLTIFLIIKTELSFDNFHSNSDRLFRIVSEDITSEGVEYHVSTHYPLPYAMRNDFPELENLVATRYEGDVAIIIKDEKTGEELKRFEEPDGVGFAESSFFEMFSFELLQGDIKTILSKPKTAVISKNTARKYFGNDNPIGKVLRIENTIDVTITGIFEDFPMNTDFPFGKLIISWESLRGYDEFVNFEKWNVRMSIVQAFIQLPENYSKDRFEEQLVGFSEKYLGKSKKASTIYHLQPIDEIHFDERYGNYDEEYVETNTLNALGLIGLLIIVTACINFINLSTALASKRAKEVGIRKVLGTTRAHVISQFMVETYSIILAALLIALGLTELILLNIQGFIEFNAPIQLDLDMYTTIFIIAMVILAGLLSGLYPALIMAGYQPANALKSKFLTTKTSGIPLRKVLVVAQFSISQILIVGTLIVSQQIDLFNNKDLGLTKEAIVVVGLPSNEPQVMALLKTKLNSSPHVLKTSNALGPAIGDGDLNTEFQYSPLGDVDLGVALKFADEDYIDIFEINMLAGRPITDYDSLNNVVVNEALLKKIQISDPEDALGKKIAVFGGESTIVGVIQDFHTMSLKNEIPACIIASYGQWYFSTNIKVSTQSIQSAVKHIEDTWSEVFPDDIINYQFLDASIEEFYNEEQRTSRLFSVFSIVAIFISCMGLFGLVTFMATQKTKEIGVRKVLGASVTSIVILFSKEFVNLIIIALVLASPIAYYFMSEWLEDFPFRVEISPFIFLLVGAITFIITGITVGYKSVSAALENPINSLRDE